MEAETSHAELLGSYARKKRHIACRLAQFRRAGESRDRELFAEMCFCLLTPQSSALRCDKAIKRLMDKDILLRGSAVSLSRVLRGLVRFHNNKASYIIAARKHFRRGMRNTIPLSDPRAARRWLVENVKGMGYKEASHFLRNIGCGGGLAILDTHILKNLVYYKVIKKIPSSMNPSLYLSIEKRMMRFSRRIGIPMEAMDLLFWSQETGHIFK